MVRSRDVVQAEGEGARRATGVPAGGAAAGAGIPGAGAAAGAPAGSATWCCGYCDGESSGGAVP